MDSALRPRDIQARIRAGESPEDVAEAAQTTVERIMPFAGPVLAERAHIAERAQRSSVRRRPAEAGARTLGEAVEAVLGDADAPPEAVEWDAWRRDDGRWALVGRYATARRSGSAELTYDAAGNYVTVDNEDARWLVGEQVAAAADDGQPDDGQPAGQPVGQPRRLHAVEQDELPLGDDAIELVRERSDEASPAAADDDALAPTPEPLADEPRRSPSVTETAELPLAVDEPLPEEPSEESGPDSSPDSSRPPRRPARRKGRASVPSWDEIMFGGSKQDH